MNIVIRNDGQVDYPWLVCDVCSEPITPTRQGLALWKGGTPHALAVHKGRCDRAADPERDALSEEITTFLANLAHNTGEAPYRPTDGTVGQ